MRQGELAHRLNPLNHLTRAKDPALIGQATKSCSRRINRVREEQVASLASPLGLGLRQHVSGVGREAEDPLPSRTALGMRRPRA